MGKPRFYIEGTYAFDSSATHDFKYLWDSYNNQSVANTLRVRDNETSEIVYNEKQETLLLKHTLPANTLTNGKTYNAELCVYDKDNNVSDYSDKIVFKCYTTPTFNINVEQNQIIRSASYGFGVEFSQIEGEELQSYLLELYDSNQILLYKSNVKYDVKSNIVLTDLMDNTSYFIIAKGETINHMDVQTDMVQFHVDYIRPISYAYMTVENRYKFGDVQFTSFIKSIEGKGKDGEPTYIDHDYVDTINGTGVCFDNNFNFTNGLLLLRGKGMTFDEPFLILTNKNYHTMNFTWKRIFYDETETERYFIEMLCYDGSVCSVHNSNIIDYTDDFVDITVIIKDNYIDIKVGG